jgi:hypothetical protein
MMEVLSGNADTSSNVKLNTSLLADEDEEGDGADNGSIGTVGEAPSFAYNVRIKVSIDTQENSWSLVISLPIIKA